MKHKGKWDRENRPFNSNQPNRLFGEHVIMEICENKKTGQAFVYLDEDENGQALMITPQGTVKALEHDLFTEPIEVENDQAVHDGKINPTQYDVYNRYCQF